MAIYMTIRDDQGLHAMVFTYAMSSTDGPWSSRLASVYFIVFYCCYIIIVPAAIDFSVVPRTSEECGFEAIMLNIDDCLNTIL